MKVLTRLRLTENFLTQDLDLQCRFHYAPRDSKSHAVERGMSSLNEAVGDGRFITPSVRTLTEAYSKKNSSLWQLMKWNRLRRSCSRRQHSDVRGTWLYAMRALIAWETSIHGHVQILRTRTDIFFYDDQDILKWHHAWSQHSCQQEASTVIHSCRRHL